MCQKRNNHSRTETGVSESGDLSITGDHSVRKKISNPSHLRLSVRQEARETGCHGDRNVENRFDPSILSHPVTSPLEVSEIVPERAKHTHTQTHTHTHIHTRTMAVVFRQHRSCSMGRGLTPPPPGNPGPLGPIQDPSQEPHESYPRETPKKRLQNGCSFSEHKIINSLCLSCARASKFRRRSFNCQEHFTLDAMRCVAVVLFGAASRR